MSMPGMRFSMHCSQGISESRKSRVRSRCSVSESASSPMTSANIGTHELS